MADFVDQKRGEMEDRLTELRPIVEEYDRLTKAVEALSNAGVGSSRRAAKPKRAAAKPKRAAAKPKRAAAKPKKRRSAASGRRGRPKGSGKRSKQALRLVTTNPGVTIPEIAKKIGIKQNYLYRVLPTLEKEGLVVKKGRGWYPTLQRG